MVSFVVALMFAFQAPAAPAAPPAQTPPPATTPPAAQTAPRRAPAPASTSTLQVRVTDLTGTPIGDARVIADGPLRRSGTTPPDGTLTLRTMTNGTYRVRAESEGFVAFEKEVILRGGTAVPVLELPLSPMPEAPLEAVPAAPVATPEPAAPVAPSATAGEPRTLSIPDLAERSLGGRDPVRTVAIGCSGLSRTQLLVVRETHATGALPDQDETLYLVAGEATLKLGDKEQSVAPGSFSIVPRGIARSVTRKGRNPAIFLSTVAGQPCGSGADR